MSKRINSKPLTIKEYTKNYKFPSKTKISTEDEYIHRTQNNFLSNIIKRKLKKNQQIKIQKDEDLNKTIENVFRKEENRIRILNILKRRKHKISYTCDRLTISKSKTRDISNDSLYDKIQGQKSFDLYTPIKKYNKLNLYTKKKLDKPLTPLLLDIKIKNVKLNINNNNNNNKKLKNKNAEKQSNKYLKSESNKIKYNNNSNKNNKIEKTDKNKKEKSNKSLRNSKKPIEKNIINLKIEKNCRIMLLKKIKNFPNNYTQKKCSRFQINKKEENYSNYTGYILINKNLGKTTEEIKLDKDEKNLKKLLIKIINEITGEQNELITKNELLQLNKAKEENELNKQKIKEQELLIKKNTNSYLNLKNEFDNLIKENNNLKEQIKKLEEKEKELNNINISFIEYKKQKSEEMQNLEFIIKLYENQLNRIKKEKNEIKKYNIEKQELFFEKTENKKIDTNIINNMNINNENINNEKEEKTSKALNRIKKKKIQENNNEQNIIKKSDKINQIVQMLEQQMKGGNKNIETNIEKNKEEKIENKNQGMKFLNLMDKKPIDIHKKKPTNKINFIE